MTGENGTNNCIGNMVKIIKFANRESQIILTVMSGKQIFMRPQDVVVLLKKTTAKGRNMSGKQLAAALGISQSEVSESLERSRISGLVDSSKRKVNTQALKGFLVYGLRYAFPVVPGGIVRGIPTAASASPLKERIVQGEENFVWPSSDGTMRGQSLSPLYPSIPFAAGQDPELYALMVAADALRIGRARERDIAIELFDNQFMSYVKQ